MSKVVQGKRQGSWKAYYYDRETGKQCWVPAEVTRAWDGLPRAHAQSAYEKWLAGQGWKPIRARQHAAFSDDTVSGYITAFMAEHAALRDTSQETRDTIEQHLRTHALAYFVGTHATKDVRQWYKHTAGYAVWLVATYPHLQSLTIKKICQNLRRFGEYLASYDIIPQPWLVRMPQRRKTRRPTPLAKPMSPEFVLSVAKKLPAHWALFVLLGYFGSLRPEEAYALTKEDFLTGAIARREAVTYDGFAKAGLGTGLAVSIDKVLVRAGLQKRTKTHYATGVVAIWHSEGAKAIAALLKTQPPGPFFDRAVKRQKWDSLFADEVKPILEAPASDLRKASGLYLARTLAANPYLIQDHFRHATLQTTQLYMRRPDRKKETADTQDFDDVG